MKQKILEEAEEGKEEFMKRLAERLAEAEEGKEEFMKRLAERLAEVEELESDKDKMQDILSY